jgi:hypothetical protein
MPTTRPGFLPLTCHFTLRLNVNVAWVLLRLGCWGVGDPLDRGSLHADAADGGLGGTATPRPARQGDLGRRAQEFGRGDTGHVPQVVGAVAGRRPVR